MIQQSTLLSTDFVDCNFALRKPFNLQGFLQIFYEN
jgi:hypothetical protein